MADETIRVDAVVIGAGPGGYVAGIRLGQLGKKAMVVERDKPGGVCLNVGCIPSKALIHAAKMYEKIRHADDIGILADNLRVDMAKMQTWKGERRQQADRRRAHAAQGQRLRLPHGHAPRSPAATPSRSRARAPTPARSHRSRPSNIVLATGSRPIEIPGFKFDGNRVVDSTGALALPRACPSAWS